jgi:hypothetical protein
LRSWSKQCLQSQHLVFLEMISLIGVDFFPRVCWGSPTSLFLYFYIWTGLLTEKMSLDSPNHQPLNHHRELLWIPGQDHGLPGSLHPLKKKKALILRYDTKIISLCLQCCVCAKLLAFNTSFSCCAINSLLPELYECSIILPLTVYCPSFWENIDKKVPIWIKMIVLLLLL